ncbi:hypothetical protein L6E12_05970 [Actinokineospora sp. PR83]|uniref:hypothetical protein n=1 Tax=Actinokineospora sp. PR83 TaxID=2884908 RepID=UPI001F374293|nr:hypothetical protein [Actinokineospora sp. PR83]MCG8915334.1 hypothetical protein [Actinokineospora sp. PR83]
MVEPILPRSRRQVAHADVVVILIFVVGVAASLVAAGRSIQDALVLVGAAGLLAAEIARRLIMVKRQGVAAGTPCQRFLGNGDRE